MLGVYPYIPREEWQNREEIRTAIFWNIILIDVVDIFLIDKICLLLYLSFAQEALYISVIDMSWRDSALHSCEFDRQRSSPTQS